MKKPLTIITCLLLYMVVTSFVIDTRLKTQKVIIKSNTIADYFNVVIAVREYCDLMSKYGYQGVAPKTVISFNTDPLGKFEHPGQLAYTLCVSKNIYLRSYRNLCGLNGEFYGTPNLFRYYDFSRSIMVHELVHVFMMGNGVKETAIQEFIAYSIGMESLQRPLKSKILASAKRLRIIPYGLDQAVSEIVLAFGDYYSLKVYLFWNGLSTEKRKEVINGIVSGKIRSIVY